MADQEMKFPILKKDQIVGYAILADDKVEVEVISEIIDYLEELEKEGAKPQEIFKEIDLACENLSIDESKPNAAKCIEVLKAQNKLKPNAEGNVFEEFWLFRAYKKSIFSALHARYSCKNLEFVTD